MNRVAARTVYVKTNNQVLFKFDISSPSIETKIDDVKMHMLKSTCLGMNDINIYCLSFYKKSTNPLPNIRLCELSEAKHMTVWCNIIRVRYQFGPHASTLYSFIGDNVMADVEEFLFVKRIKLPSTKKLVATCNGSVLTQTDTYLSRGLDCNTIVYVMSADK